MITVVQKIIIAAVSGIVAGVGAVKVTEYTQRKLGERKIKEKVTTETDSPLGRERTMTETTEVRSPSDLAT